MKAGDSMWLHKQGLVLPVAIIDPTPRYGLIDVLVDGKDAQLAFPEHLSSDEKETLNKASKFLSDRLQLINCRLEQLA